MNRPQDENGGLKSRDLSGESKPKKKKSKALKIFGVISAVIISLLIVTAVTLFILISTGKNAALKDNESAVITVPSEAEVSVEPVDNTAESGSYVYRDGKKYKYNDKVTTILIAGIDKHSEEQTGEYGTAGQADMLMLCALDTETGRYKLMAVSRDAMVDVNVITPDGSFDKTEKQQICLAYAYGDGAEKSCENLKKSVSRLMCGIPVNSYVAVDLDAIPIINDSVGGVKVKVNEDLSSRDPALYEGAEVVLDGKQAETFVRARDITGDENQNNLRMERQKIFVTSLIRQGLALTKEDITTPVNVYNSTSDYLVTDIDIPMITYYASIFVRMGFEPEENLIKIPGTTTHGERYAEYYVDNKALFDIILDVYYTEVE